MLMARFKAIRYLLSECQTERGKQAITLSKFTSHYVLRHFTPWAMNKNPVNKQDGENWWGGGNRKKERKKGLPLFIRYCTAIIYIFHKSSVYMKPVQTSGLGKTGNAVMQKYIFVSTSCFFDMLEKKKDSSSSCNLYFLQ